MQEPAVATPSAPPEPAARRAAVAHRTPRRRLVADRVARWAVTGGGLAIIASILGILIFILVEVTPLLGGADVEAGRAIGFAGDAPVGLLGDEYRTHAVSLDAGGVMRIFDLDGSQRPRELSIELPASAFPLRPQPATADPGLAAATADGRILFQPIDWRITFIAQDRQVAPMLGNRLLIDVDTLLRPLRAFSIRIDEEGGMTAVGVDADDRLLVRRRTIEENFLTGEQIESWERFEQTLSVPVDQLILDRDQKNLYGGNAEGQLIWWRLEDGRPEPPQVVSGVAAVTALSLLIGDRSLVVGRDDGTISIWFPVRSEGGASQLSCIRHFEEREGGIRALAPSQRNKGFVAADENGGLGLYYSTSERILWTGRSPAGPPSALFFAPKSDGLLLASAGRLDELLIDNPHPEVSWRALFGRVWYEGYEKPALIWQSSGGTDDFEAKLSLTPLIVGTLKGTLYSLILAIPLGVFGAMYTSQFMHHSLRRYVKPTVEIMAALPSVVLGFLAGLWLAPRLESMMPALLLMLLVLPALVVAAGSVWRILPSRIQTRVPTGTEALFQIGVLGLGMWLCLRVGDDVARLVFAGSFQDWLRESTGLAYDQRNAVVVGLAMGFAVIPIVFSIAEDAFSNVPRNLLSGSLALGANRWQTVTRIILPSASPGIFSAIMIGFGRAVGETMIVLMATGNTPILDWNPFNGFRTLSANIAVEIPEAPHGGTLYRALFLAALLLFVFTFFTNTIAELVRQRLRRRYATL